jgi:hypothetical protein
MDFRQTGLMKINFLNAPRILLCALIVLSAIIFSGCFMADNKFYRDSDIITDSHIGGKFMPADAVTNKDDANCSLIIESETNNHYIATYHEAKQWIKFDTVFFRLGTNTFVDIHRLADTGESHNSGNETPSGYELLRITALCEHCAFRTVIKDDQIEFQLIMGGNDLVKLIREAPEMKVARIEEAETTKFTGSTEELRNFLIKHVSDGTALKDHSLWVRSDK